MNQVKLLLDSCVWGGTRKTLSELGLDVIWSGDWPEDPGDDEILARAFEEKRVLITLDKDFGELAVLRGAPHFGIVRLVGVPARQQADVCLSLLEHHFEDLGAGALITVQSGRVRVRFSR